MKNIYYCSHCNAEVKTDVKITTETYEIKGEKITVSSRVRICDVCNAEIWDDELENESMIKVYNQYRDNHNLLRPNKIKQIREKYSLTQSAFSKLLGLGEKTITRYENGALQEKAQDNLIYLMDDLNVFLSIWNKNNSCLSIADIIKTESRLLKLKHDLDWVKSNEMSEYKYNKYVYREA